MIDIHVGIAILCLIAIVILVVFILCHSLDALTYIFRWIYSSKEEKLGLTRAKGLYNANGYLVHSDSDIQLGISGSFKRFDSVDKDFGMSVACTSFSEFDQATSVRPTTESVTTSTQQKSLLIKQDGNEKQTCEERTSNDTVTSISPIPRPISSINMFALATNSQHPNISSSAFLPSHISSNQRSNVENQHVETDDLEAIAGLLKRAMSCESVCSDTSVALGDLEDADISGYLCIGFEYESESSDLIVNVLEARNLKRPTNEDYEMDSYVRVFLLPDKETNIQTKVYRSTSSPSYKERFLFPLNPREQSQKSVCFHVYSIDRLSHVLIGEGEIRLSDVSLRQPVTTWVSLTDTGQEKCAEHGELMFSLSYLPTAERLTVVVVKARKLKFENESGDPFVKVYLLQHGKKIHKKKTSTKKSENSPIFNEAMMFSVPAHSLQTIQLRLTVAEAPRSENASSYCIGHVIIGAQASGRSLNHWNQMLTALRKPVAMWHPLRK